MTVFLRLIAWVEVCQGTDRLLATQRCGNYMKLCEKRDSVKSPCGLALAMSGEIRAMQCSRGGITDSSVVIRNWQFRNSSANTMYFGCQRYGRSWVMIICCTASRLGSPAQAGRLERNSLRLADCNGPGLPAGMRLSHNNNLSGPKGLMTLRIHGEFNLIASQRACQVNE